MQAQLFILSTLAVKMSGPPKSISSEDNIGRCTDLVSFTNRLEQVIHSVLLRMVSWLLFLIFNFFLRFSSNSKFLSTLFNFMLTDETISIARIKIIVCTNVCQQLYDWLSVVPGRLVI